ncbi:MAG: hypothetical protein CSA39_01490 [Flavobacteriales bacterium]|nr:MAG: hypothetical protein CSA39_01490 [Flavobacteriales bacterium]
MKNTIYKLLIFIIAPLLIVGCDDNIVSELNPNAGVIASLSEDNIILKSENADMEALTITWTAPDFGFDAAPVYKVYMDNASNNFSKPEEVAVGQNLQKTFTVKELNKILRKLDLEAGTESDVAIKVVAKLGEYHGVESAVLTLKATSYEDILDLSTTWGVVGSAANDWGATPDLPFYQTGTEDVYVAYVTLKDGEIKFRENNAWDNNYGDNGADGTLEPDGANIAVTAGTYKIVINLDALTYNIEPYSWGITGDATTNGWDGPDMPLEYDPYTDQWRAIVKLSDGEIKIRQNNSWDINYGDDGADGTLEANGANIAVTAGFYHITVNFNNSAYTIEPIDVWGIVGSATPNGWDGPDTKFKLDYSQDRVWYINNITLTDGEIKFRQNDAWDVNYGDTGNDKTLELNGDNIPVTAGTYKIVLDFSNTDSPTYSME